MTVDLEDLVALGVDGIESLDKLAIIESTRQALAEYFCTYVRESQQLGEAALRWTGIGLQMTADDLPRISLWFSGKMQKEDIVARFPEILRDAFPFVSDYIDIYENTEFRLLGPRAGLSNEKATASSGGGVGPGTPIEYRTPVGSGTAANPCGGDQGGKHCSSTTGTLTALLTDESRLWLLTAGHVASAPARCRCPGVLAIDGGAELGSKITPVLQPDCCGGGKAAMGRLVDAAVAPLDEFKQTAKPLGIVHTTKPVIPDPSSTAQIPVQRVGNVNTGVNGVAKFHIDGLQIIDDGGIFADQWLVIPDTGGAFCEGGDSGCLIVANPGPKGQVLGMLIAEAVNSDTGMQVGGVVTPFPNIQAGLKKTFPGKVFQFSNG